MRVLLDTHMFEPFQTGIGRYFLNLSRFLPRLKEDIQVFLYKPTIKNGLYRIFFDFNRQSYKKKADLIHVSNFTPFIKTVPLVVTIHDLCFKTIPETFGLKSRLAFSLFFERSLKQADKIICVSKTVKKQLLNFYPQTKQEKIFVIYEAADPVFKKTTEKGKVTKALQEKFGITEDFFLVVGAIEKRKRPDEIIDAFITTLKTRRNLNLVFTGPNKMSYFFWQRYSQFINQGKIKILGYVKDQDLNLLYNGTTSLIYDSLCEGFGLPIIEAMQCQTPVICSDIEVAREIASFAGLYVKNKTALKKLMLNMIKNDSFHRTYAARAFKRSRYFSWKKTAQETLQVYQHVLAKISKSS